MPIRCVNGKKARRGSKVILTGVNGNVIMSGCRDADPDDARREALAESGIISQLKLAVGSSGFDGWRSVWSRKRAPTMIMTVSAKTSQIARPARRLISLTIGGLFRPGLQLSRRGIHAATYVSSKLNMIIVAVTSRPKDR